LTTYNATAGGKNGPAARAFLVRQAFNALSHKAQGPFADMTFSHANLARCGRKGLAVGEQ